MRIDKKSFMAALAAAGLIGSAVTGCGGDAEATETESTPDTTTGSETVSEDTTAYEEEEGMGDVVEEEAAPEEEEDLGPTPE